ncbi:hypothetical protein N7490_002236 [Penicillium lividum]|nr:hypothetical protein N7490_002236 [Penicillium lividum]
MELNRPTGMISSAALFEAAWLPSMCCLRNVVCNNVLWFTRIGRTITIDNGSLNYWTYEPAANTETNTTCTARVYENDLNTLPTGVSSENEEYDEEHSDEAPPDDEGYFMNHEDNDFPGADDDGPSHACCNKPLTRYSPATFAVSRWRKSSRSLGA